MFCMYCTSLALYMQPNDWWGISCLEVMPFSGMCIAVILLLNTFKMQDLKKSLLFPVVLVEVVELLSLCAFCLSYGSASIS